VHRLRRFSVTPTAANVAVQDITSNLPGQLAVSALAVDRMNSFTIYAGTDRGVYRGRSMDHGDTWTWDAYMNGLPATKITRFQVHPVTGVVRASTYGRSAYEVNTDWPIGSLMSATGVPTFLRVHDPGTGYGPPGDFLDAEVIVKLNSEPAKAFGFQLRDDPAEGARQGMLAQLLTAFRKNRTVRIDYIRTGLHNGRAIRVETLN